MNGTLEQLFAFTKLMNDYRLMKRRLIVNGEERNENDVEHSYQLAMLCWYIIDTEKLSLDLNLVLKYALLHDLVEIYAGDTPFFTQDQELRDSKQSREHTAFQKLVNTYPEFSAIEKYIAEYEARENDESKFVYAADKLQPVLNIYLDGGRTWKNEHVTHEMEMSLKPPKMAVDPTIAGIYAEFQKILTLHKEELFSKE